MTEPLPPPVLFALNHVLGQAAWARERLRPFAGRVARFELGPFAGAFCIGEDGSLSAPSADAAPDVSLKLPPNLPLLLLQGMDAAMRNVRLSGQVDLAEALGFVLRNLRWDAEEDLSRVFGDIAAHQLMRGADQLFGWQRQAVRNAGENLAEYFTEEQPMIATPAALAEFAAEVDRLRDDLARLEKRVVRLRAPR